MNIYNINKKRQDLHKLGRMVCTVAFAMMASHLNAQYAEGNTRAWGDMDYTGSPWVQNISKPNYISQGLQNRHISLWAAHGRFYNNDQKTWKWQRPNLFCTVEDLFTLSVVSPYLIPMLENAGAIVFSPRERDLQINEVIVDNDDWETDPFYKESSFDKPWKTCDSLGYARRKDEYNEGESPFWDGSVRMCRTSKHKSSSYVAYQPKIPETGSYAVYVSYESLPKSVTDARYTVYHQGIATHFKVNQQMGGGTWVYLGNFVFDKGCNKNNRVVITNYSDEKGVVSTDAVRFGGGMSNISRGAGPTPLPKCLMGARYWAQNAGMPSWVYSSKGGINDYGDDINCRSLMTNYLAGGSIYEPTKEGLHVPFELALAIHSDAGYEKDGKSITGTLSICTTNFNDGVFSNGTSRMTSKDLAQILRDNTVKDIQAVYKNWNARYVWDRNYSETRLPEIPSAILETLSHQNFPDMKLAQDPMFKFTLARSVYKTLLRYICSNHGKKYVVQPLPPKEFHITMDDKSGNVRLEWEPQYDEQEPSARPLSYNVYTSSGYSGFDNGRNVKTNKLSVTLKPNVQYNFKVAAVNEGGESFTTETLSAYYNPSAKKTVMVVNNFHRLASPQVIDNDSLQGFDMDQDPGVSYGLNPGWTGKQQCFDITKMGIEGPGGLGYCGDEMVGKFVAGNDFNYTVEHTKAIISTGRYNVVSCSAQALESGHLNLTQNEYPIVDIIEGLERNDGYTPEYYKSFTPGMQNIIKSYALSGGKLIVSGSYIGSDMQKPEEKKFLADIFKVAYTPDDSAKINGSVVGFNRTFLFHKELNSEHYAATHPNILQPLDNAKTLMTYSDEHSAGVGFKGKSYSCFVMGFPFECIQDRNVQATVMGNILNYIDN